MNKGQPIQFQMAEPVSLSLTLPQRSSPTMAAFSTTATSRILPTAASASASRARLSLSSSFSSLKCLRSSPLVSHLFLNQVQSLSLSLPLMLCLFLCITISEKLALFLFLFWINYQKRSPVVRVSERGLSSAATPKCAASDPDQLKSAREDIKELLKSNFCHPILVFASFFAFFIKCLEY